MDMIARHFKKWGHIYKVKVTGGPRSTAMQSIGLSHFLLHMLECIRLDLFATISSEAKYAS